MTGKVIIKLIILIGDAGDQREGAVQDGSRLVRIINKK